jgi:hypothetical protein
MVKTNFRLHDYGRGIFLVTNPIPEELAYAFLRAQERSSNPDWIGKGPFSVDQYLAWYDKMRARPKDGRWPYHQEYLGFTVQSSAFKPLYSARWSNSSTPIERQLLSLLEKPTDFGRKKAFIIGAEEGDLETMDHELSCALFYLSPDYRRKTLKIIANINPKVRQQMDNWFINDGSYLPEVIPREIVAEFADWYGSWMFKRTEANINRNRGIGKENLKLIHKQIRAVYEPEFRTLKKLKLHK